MLTMVGILMIENQPQDVSFFCKVDPFHGSVVSKNVRLPLQLMLNSWPGAKEYKHGSC